jgi:hypothetical protein
VIPSFFVDQLTDEEKLCGHFMQDNATAYIVSNPKHALDEVFIEQDISWGLWPSQSLILLFVCYMMKEEMYVNNLLS